VDKAASLGEHDACAGSGGEASRMTTSPAELQWHWSNRPVEREPLTGDDVLVLADAACGGKKKSLKSSQSASTSRKNDKK
jgi:hypothetical protein